MRQENLAALELERKHVGLLVKVVTESLSVVGTLERIEHDDDMELTADWRPVHRTIRTRLWISGWRGEVNPQQVVTVEWPDEQPELAGPLTGAALDEIARQALEELEGRDVVKGDVVDGSVWVTGRVVPCGPQLNGNWHCNVAKCSRPEDDKCPLRMLEELGEGQE